MRSVTTCLLGTVAALTVMGHPETASAAAQYKIDPAQSAVLFKVKNRDVSHVWGRFNKVSGTIDVNILSSPSSFTFSIEVMSGSVDSNDKKRDAHLKKADFLNASAYPKITFQGQSTKRLEDNRFEVEGQLSFMGTTKDLTVIFELTGVKRTDQTEYRLGGETTFTVKRSEFGMGYMVPEIADEVTIIVNLEGVAVLRPAG